MEKINVILDEGAVMPTRAHELDAGLDLYSPVSGTVFPKDSLVIDTGVHFEIPKGYVGMIKSKSGMNVNEDITSEGVVDAGYTGSIKVKLYNHGDQRRYIKKGHKVSQFVILPIATPIPVLVSEFADTDRGSAGFGSTGKY